MNIFEVSAKLMIEQDNETLKLVKRSILIEGETFTEMDAVATEWLANQTNYEENTIIEAIKRVKYSDILCNSTLSIDRDLLFNLTEYSPEDIEGRFWELQVAFSDEGDNGKEKITKEKFIVPAISAKEAINSLEKKMANLTLDWKVINSKETPIYACLVFNDTFDIAAREIEDEADEILLQLKQVPEDEE